MQNQEIRNKKEIIIIIIIITFFFYFFKKIVPQHLSERKDYNVSISPEVESTKMFLY